MARTFLLALALSILPHILALPTGDVDQHAFSSKPTVRKDAKVLILGGGMAGITAARALHDHGIDDFIVVEARHELGGRMMSHTLGAPGHQYTVELGANWVQGTQSPKGTANPVWTLAKKHGLRMERSEYFEGLGAIRALRSGHTTRLIGGVFAVTYDETGPVNFLEEFNKSVENFDRLIASAGR